MTNHEIGSSDFGEDMQTIWVSETLPEGMYTKSWHTKRKRFVYAGHVGINGESVKPGWDPMNILPFCLEKHPRGVLSPVLHQCKLGRGGLAARLIPGMKEVWNHPQFLPMRIDGCFRRMSLRI